MDLRRIFLFGIAFISFFFSLTTSAATVIDNNAPVVSLRTTCTEAGGSIFINNCFTDMPTLANWINLTRKPKVSAPLLVEIGPGNFEGPLTCRETPFSHVTFRGAGMKRTIIGRLILGSGCDELTFEDLTVTQQEGSGYAVIILSPGINTTWNGVLLNGEWNELGSPGVCNPGKHYWFHSRINGEYKIRCDKSWFFGSEIVGETAFAGPGLYNLVVFDVAQNGEAHVYGSNINATSDPAWGAVLAKRHVAVYASGGGKVHIHGTGIDVNSHTASNIVALEVGLGGEIHANESAYNMKAPGGTVTRILNPNNVGHVHAPYVWQEHPQPPSINSQNGADMTVETDCAANGCQNAGTETHLLIYNKSCTGAGGPWFDVVTRACR